ncbi:retrovirus-related pol polyprotein from transposon TNT 1-94 [Tanacetum coccineum]
MFWEWEEVWGDIQVVTGFVLGGKDGFRISLIIGESNAFCWDILSIKRDIEYNLETWETFNSRDVIFKENVFPFKECNKSIPPVPKIDFPNYEDDEYAENPTSFPDSVLNDAILNTPNSLIPATNEPILPWPLHQLEINNAFLHGYIDEEIYMTPPEGYTKAQPGQVCKLNRSLYRLKQASMQWNQELTKFLIAEGYQQSKHDYSLFVKSKGESFSAVLVYVDDVLIIGNSSHEIQHLKQALDAKFTIKDLGLAKYFLRVEILMCRCVGLFNSAMIDLSRRAYHS